MVLSAKVGLYKSGKRDAAKIMQELPVTPNINKIKKKFFDPPNMPVPYTPEEALALFVDGDYSKHTYKLMQAGAKQRNANTYSTCHIIQLEKEKCYPIYMAFPDVSGEIPLQYLVNKTAERLVYLQSDVLEQKKSHEIYLAYKWGCDGSSGHSNYKQKFNNNNADNSDQHLFAVCLVPLQLKANNVCYGKIHDHRLRDFVDLSNLVFKKKHNF